MMKHANTARIFVIDETGTRREVDHITSTEMTISVQLKPTPKTKEA